MAEKPKKKVVTVEAPATSTKRPSGGGTRAAGGGAAGSDGPPPGWTPTPEAKAQAGRFRLFAVIGWVLAIAGELFAIFWVLRQVPVQMWLLIVMIVVVGILAVAGSFFWKKANRLDPASRQDTVRFFVQNQLGAIITVIAFLPLIILVFLNKDMDAKQKGLAGGVAIAVAVVAVLLNADFKPVSTEQYADETQTVIEYTGEDLVFWTASGKVFHLCAEASAVNLESKDNQIYQGTVAAAHAAGKERLTKQVAQEVKQCGLTAPTPSPSDLPTLDPSAPAVQPTEESAE